MKISGFALLVVLLFAGLCLSNSGSPEEWGFWGHRRINRMAAFTLPAPMAAFFKQNIEFVTEHAVDPDKRRYATRHEAVRHYIDIDHWGEPPFPELPRDWTEALMKFTEIGLVRAPGDTVRLVRDTVGRDVFIALPLGAERLRADYRREYREFFRRQILEQYYEDEWLVPCDSLAALFGLPPGNLACQAVYGKDHFSQYGILPYHLLAMQQRLTQAFRRKDKGRILRLATEMGHYIGDAHVPLHTTTNYNGQLTNQLGIHAFWESRLPELFADKEYDYFVGRAQYIDSPREYFWDIVLTSYALVDSVLLIEKSLSQEFPPDKQYCYEERLGQTIRTQCRDYAAAYHRRLSGMVEDRLRASILSIGSCWYTAWVDAGQPDLLGMGEYQPPVAEIREQEELEQQARSGEAKGRAHE
jgi:hypothetical protein